MFQLVDETFDEVYEDNVDNIRSECKEEDGRWNCDVTCNGNLLKSTDDRPQNRDKDKDYEKCRCVGCDHGKVYIRKLAKGLYDICPYPPASKVDRDIGYDYPNHNEPEKRRCIEIDHENDGLKSDKRDPLYCSADNDRSYSDIECFNETDSSSNTTPAPAPTTTTAPVHDVYKERVCQNQAKLIDDAKDKINERIAQKRTLLASLTQEKERLDREISEAKDLKEKVGDPIGECRDELVKVKKENAKMQAELGENGYLNGK